MELHRYEVKILKSIKPGEKYSQKDIASLSKLNEDAIKRAIGWLEQKGLIKVITKTKVVKLPTEELKKYEKSGFPEYLLTKKALELKEIAINKLTNTEKRIGIPWAKKKGWVTIEKGKVIPLITSLPENYRPDDDELVKRKLIIIKPMAEYTIELTSDGEKLRNQVIKNNVEIGDVTILTKEMISSGEWRQKKFKEYNVTAESEKIYPGKRHVLSRLMDKIKNIFVELGFEEMDGPIIDSSFWVFDALFQPQDHPARELADTFYVNKSFNFGDDETPREVVDKVKKAHEEGWRYNWSEDVAKKGILRCHTTSLSARTLYHKVRNTIKPGKYFAIGKVYRNEAIDYKHLAEFHQVEGIIISEDVGFKHLLGILKEYYNRLGFENVKFYPSYFPYTEPSVEIYVHFKERNEWIEMGGAGIFRPEVSIPLCNRYPVLAFGLSLERILMIQTDLKDIRLPYRNRIDWLRDMTYGKVGV